MGVLQSDVSEFVPNDTTDFVKCQQIGQPTCETHHAVLSAMHGGCIDFRVSLDVQAERIR